MFSHWRESWRCAGYSSCSRAGILLITGLVVQSLTPPHVEMSLSCTSLTFKSMQTKAQFAKRLPSHLQKNRHRNLCHCGSGSLVFVDKGLKCAPSLEIPRPKLPPQSLQNWSLWTPTIITSSLHTYIQQTAWLLNTLRTKDISIAQTPRAHTLDGLRRRNILFTS